MQRRGNKINFKKKELQFPFFRFDFVALKNKFSFKLVFVFCVFDYLINNLHKNNKPKINLKCKIKKKNLIYSKLGDLTLFLLP